MGPVLCPGGHSPAGLNSIHEMLEAPPAVTTESVPRVGDGAKLWEGTWGERDGCKKKFLYNTCINYLRGRHWKS